jgi:glycerophosphoryl diester phosphodiesterase
MKTGRKTMKYIAHRGACLEEKENTLAALEKGAAYGAYAVECDPQFTRDGAAILFHDPDLKRMADDPRRIADLAYS